MLLGGGAFGQSLLPVSGPGGFGAAPGNFIDVYGGTGVTSARVGVFYGGGQLHVDDFIAEGRATILQSDFATFVHHRKADLRDAYFSGVLGMGTQGMEFLTLGVATNLGITTRFKQYTDPGNYPKPPLPPERWYRGVLGIYGLGNEESGLITLNNKNRYWAVDLCARLPILAAFDLLGGYKFVSIKSTIDPLSFDIPPGTGGLGFATYPGLPGQQGWIPTWRYSADTSATSFDMYQKITWHGPFIGLCMANVSGYGFDWFFDTRLYPWLFGKYTFTWNGDWFEAPGDSAPAIYGSQATEFSGNRRWGVDLDFRCRRPWRDLFAVQFEARYSYAWMSGSCVEYQTLGNIYGGGFLAGNYAQNTPEHLNIRQQLWMVGGNLEIGF